MELGSKLRQEVEAKVGAASHALVHDLQENSDFLPQLLRS
jgi:hypothetical protein